MADGQIPNLPSVDEPLTHGWLGGWITRGAFGGAVLTAFGILTVRVWNWGAGKVAKLDKVEADLASHRQDTDARLAALKQHVDDGFGGVINELRSQRELLLRMVGPDK